MTGSKKSTSNERTGGSYRYEIRLVRGRGQSIIFNVTLGSDDEAVERARYLLDRHEFEIAEVWYAMQLVRQV